MEATTIYARLRRILTIAREARGPHDRVIKDAEQAMKEVRKALRLDPIDNEELKGVRRVCK